MKTYQKEIDATHPTEDGAGELELAADALAIQLVGERHEKRDLVNLVRWLVLRRPSGLLPDELIPCYICGSLPGKPTVSKGFCSRCGNEP